MPPQRTGGLSSQLLVVLLGRDGALAALTPLSVPCRRRGFGDKATAPVGRLGLGDKVNGREQTRMLAPRPAGWG